MPGGKKRESREWARSSLQGLALVLTADAVLLISYLMGASTRLGWTLVTAALLPVLPLAFAGSIVGYGVGVALCAVLWGRVLRAFQSGVAKRGHRIAVGAAALGGLVLGSMASRMTEGHRNQRCDELFELATEDARGALHEATGATSPGRCASRSAWEAARCLTEGPSRSNPHFFFERGYTSHEPELCRVRIEPLGERALLLTQEPRARAPFRTVSVRLD